MAEFGLVPVGPVNSERLGPELRCPLAPEQGSLPNGECGNKISPLAPQYKRTLEGQRRFSKANAFILDELRRPFRASMAPSLMELPPSDRAAYPNGAMK